LDETQAILFGLVETFHRNKTANIFKWLIGNQDVSYIHCLGIGDKGRASTRLILGWRTRHFKESRHEKNTR